MLRLVLSWNDGEARGLMVLWAIWIFALATLLLMAEFRKPENVIVWFPLLFTRSGRGAMFAFLTLPMFTKEPSTIALGILVLVFGAMLNILLGWSQPPVQLQEIIQNVSPTNV